jgi:hypothetical protein
MDLNGWDTAFVANADVINDALGRSTAKLCQKFSYSEGGFSASGEFGTWSIVPGGSQDLLMLQIEILSGSMVMTADGAPIDVGGMSAQLLVNLQLLPATATPATQLTFDFRGVPPATGPGVVTPHDVVNSGALTLVQKAALGNAIANSLVENAGEISFVFATINPAAASGVAWLTPVASRYAYLSPAGMPAALAILSVVTQRDTSGLPLNVDPGILQGTGNAGLAISPALFLQNVMGPALLQSFQTSGTLTVDGSGILRNTGTLGLPEIDKAGESYYPQLDSFAAAITDTQVNVNISGSCDMHMGVSMTFSAGSSVTVSLTGNATSLQLATVGTPTFHKDVSIPWYDHLFDIFGGLAEMILQICVAAISSELGGGISDVTSAQALVQSAPTVVAWADAGGFQARAATLATAFCLRGSLS